MKIAHNNLSFSEKEINLGFSWDSTHENGIDRLLSRFQCDADGIIHVCPDFLRLQTVKDNDGIEWTIIACNLEFKERPSDPNMFSNYSLDASDPIVSLWNEKEFVLAVPSTKSEYVSLMNRFYTAFQEHKVKIVWEIYEGLKLSILE